MEAVRAAAGEGPARGPLAPGARAVAASTAAASRAATGLRWAGLAVAWLAGCAVQLQQPRLWTLAAYALLVLAALLAAVASVSRAGRMAPMTRWTLQAAAVAALAFGSAGWQAGLRLADTLPAALEGQDVELTGVVASLPQTGASGTRFRFEVEGARWRGEPVALPRLVGLGWYRQWHDEAVLADPREGLRAGQRWRLVVRLRAPHGQLNPHGFDHELWLFEQGVRAGGYVRALPGAERQDGAPALLAEGVGHPVERARQAVRDAIEARLAAEPRAAGVLTALAVGDQNAIEREDWDLYRNAGIAHLMSISGLHITMFAWLAGLAVARAWRCSARLMLALPAPLAARWVGLAAAASYAVFSGWGVPAQRTICMLATTTLLLSLGRRWPWPLVLLAAAVAVSALDPWALLQPGFWLSFAAVGLLIASEPLQRSRAEAGGPVPAGRGGPARAAALAREALRTQLVASLGLAPLSLVFFQQVSLVGLAANPVAIPAVTLLITPLALLGVIVPPLWSLGGALVGPFNALLAGLTSLPAAVWVAPAAAAWAQAAALLGAALAMLPLPWRLRLLAVPLVLPLFAPAVERPPEGRFELIAADVGQGTAVLLRTRSHLLLYDAGPRYSPESDAGERVLVPLLRALGERRVDLLMLSHRDSDHVGGAASVLRALPVSGIWSSLEDAHPLLAQARSPHRRCEAGQRWDWDGVRFEVLHPQAADHERAGIRPNALSCVLRVAGHDRSALLAGDIEQAQEAALVAHAGAALASDLLVVPHHGSRTSSSAAFLDAVQPRVALVQAGYRNRFGHPAADVVERYRARGIDVVRSDACGAWSWPTEGAPLCEREAAARYWHHRLAPP